MVALFGDSGTPTSGTALGRKGGSPLEEDAMALWTGFKPTRSNRKVTLSLAMPDLKSGIFVLLLFALATAPASAQLYSASVTGTVTDPSGALIRSAKVTLVE